MSTIEQLRKFFRSEDPFSAVVSGHAVRAISTPENVKDYNSGMWTSGESGCGMLTCPTAGGKDDRIMFCIFKGAVKTGDYVPQEGHKKEITAREALQWCFDDLKYRGEVLCWVDETYQKDILRHVKNIQATGNGLVFGIAGGKLKKFSPEEVKAEKDDNDKVKTARQELEAKLLAVQELTHFSDAPPSESELFGEPVSSYSTDHHGIDDLKEALHEETLDEGEEGNETSEETVEAQVQDQDQAKDQDNETPVKMHYDLCSGQQLMWNESGDKSRLWSVRCGKGKKAAEVICLWNDGEFAELALSGRITNSPEARDAFAAAIMRLDEEEIQPVLMLDELDAAGHRLIKGFGLIPLRKIRYIVGRL